MHTKLTDTFKYHTLFIILILGLLSSCKNDFDDISNSPIIGSWVNVSYDNNLITLEKSNNLKSNDYGITFKGNGSLVERKNSGWCGTPPVSYSDFDGAWRIKGSLIQISVGYWGGQTEYKWKIVSIDNKKLVIEAHY